MLTSGQSPGDTGFLNDLCRRRDCLASLGSDFHSPTAPWCELGGVGPLPDGLKPVWTLFVTPDGASNA